MLRTLTASLQAALAERLTLLLNHVLAGEPVAAERLRAHGGRSLQLQLDGWPALAAAAARARVSRHAGGPARMVRRASRRRAPDLRLRLDASNPALAMAQWAAGERPRVDVQGDAQFATDLSWLMDNLRWDVQDDLARLVGEAPAHEIARLGRLLAGGLREAVRALSGWATRRRRAGVRPAMRHFARLVFIVFTVLRFGLDELALSGFRQRWVRVLVRVMTIGRRLDAPRGQRLRMALEQLGPIFVKFGQVLSTRRDLLPADIADELARLQDRVPPFPGGRRRGASSSRPSASRSRRCSRSSRPSRWPARRSRRCTSPC